MKPHSWRGPIWLAVVVGWFSLGCAGITPRPTATPQPVDPTIPVPTATTVVTTTAAIELADLMQAKSIYIEDDWTGLSPAAPIEAHYDLVKTADGFGGEAAFAAGGYSGNPLTATQAVLIPSANVEAFLGGLAITQLEEGEYIPNITHTDDYPSVVIRIELDNTTVVFASKSQGEGNTPWKVTLGNQAYISRSTAPADALTSLGPYLAQDILQGLIEQIR